MPSWERSVGNGCLVAVKWETFSIACAATRPIEGRLAVVSLAGMGSAEKSTGIGSTETSHGLGDLFVVTLLRWTSMPFDGCGRHIRADGASADEVNPPIQNRCY
jgi:hypothetical protein